MHVDEFVRRCTGPMGLSPWTGSAWNRGSSRSTATECPPELAAEAEVVLQCGPKKLVFVSKLIAEDQGVNIQFVYSYVYNQEAYLSDGALEFIDQFAPLYTYNSQKQNALHLRPDRNTLTTFHLSHTRIDRYIVRSSDICTCTHKLDAICIVSLMARAQSMVI